MTTKFKVTSDDITNIIKPKSKLVPMSLRISPELKSDIAKFAKSNNTTTSAVITGIMQNFIDSQKVTK